MAYATQLPGSLSYTRFEFNEHLTPAAGSLSQPSCYSYVEKISSSVGNPVGLQHDVLYPNTIAALNESYDGVENETPLVAGCVSHQTDKEFPLESKTPFPLPLIMYPTETDGTTLDSVDMCAQPVLNWEAFMQDLKGFTYARQPQQLKHHLFGRNWGQQANEGASQRTNLALDTIPEELVEVSLGEDDVADQEDEAALQMCTQEQIDHGKPGKQKKKKPEVETSRLALEEGSSNKGHLPECTESVEESRKKHKIIPTWRLKKLHADKNTQHGNKYGTTKARNRPLDVENACEQIDEEYNPFQECDSKEKRLNRICWKRIKNQPKLRVEGSWNHLYGGYNGACCFTKDTSSKTLNLYLSKGSQLRAVQLSPAQPSAMFSFKIDSVWDEVSDCTTNTPSRDHPFDELIFQIVSNESNKLLGVRRGKCVQIYDTEDRIPDLLETITNTHYTKKTDSKNPLLRGLDFNPMIPAEIITIDENLVIKIYNFCNRTVSDQFVLPNSRPYIATPKNYPDFKINDAVGITFANVGQLFYAWANSVVYMGDRRSRKHSRDHIIPLFDLRTHIHSLAMSNQNHFHEKTAALTDYMSCVRRSKKEHYYYVGTSTKIYLMDERVPSYPVIMAYHALKSPPTYMDVFSDDDQNFETIVATSQRSSETVCMVSDSVHLECASRQGCKSRGPLLYCYPSHLHNSSKYFDDVVKEGYDFPFPVDTEVARKHCYAWPTGLAAYPCASKGSSTNHPGGMIVVTSNNFGDVFWQEWDQKPMPHHKKYTIADYKLKEFVTDWNTEMKKGVTCVGTRKLSKNPKKSADCSLFLEPAAKEIERLQRVRDSPFDIFKPDQVQNHASLNSMISMDSMFEKLMKYKNPRVKGLLDVWRTSRNQAPPETIEIEVKIEPVNLEELPSPPSSTIDLDSNREEQTELSNIETEIQNSLNFNIQEDMDPLTQNEQWSSLYSGIFETPQPFNHSRGDDDFDEPMIQPSASSSRTFLKPTKKRRSGFL